MRFGPSNVRCARRRALTPKPGEPCGSAGYNSNPAVRTNMGPKGGDAESMVFAQYMPGICVLNIGLKVSLQSTCQKTSMLFLPRYYMVSCQFFSRRIFSGGCEIAKTPRQKVGTQKRGEGWGGISRQRVDTSEEEAEAGFKENRPAPSTPRCTGCSGLMPKIDDRSVFSSRRRSPWTLAVSECRWT